MNPATFIFILTYVLVSLGENSPRKLDRPTATLIGAVLMVISGSLSRAEAHRAIDFGTLAILFGLMVLLTVLMQSGLPTWLAFKVLNRCRNPRELLAIVVFASGLGSALMLNDTVCLLGTPLLLQVTTQAGLRPIPFLLALATSANIGSVMTLTGNPQNIIIGEASGWTWAGFALRMVPIGLVALAANWLILSLLYRRSLKPAMMQCQLTDLKDMVQQRLAIKSLCIFVGLITAFLLGAPMDVSSVCAAALLLVWANRPPREALVQVDWSLLLFFAGLFVVVAGLVKAEGYLLEGWIHYLGTEIGFRTLTLFSTATGTGQQPFFQCAVGYHRQPLGQTDEPSQVFLAAASPDQHVCGQPDLVRERGQCHSGPGGPAKSRLEISRLSVGRDSGYPGDHHYRCPAALAI